MLVVWVYCGFGVGLMLIVELDFEDKWWGG
jgi:hypothetical protein